MESSFNLRMDSKVGGSVVAFILFAKPLENTVLVMANQTTRKTILHLTKPFTLPGRSDYHRMLVNRKRINVPAFQWISTAVPGKMVHKDSTQMKLHAMKANVNHCYIQRNTDNYCLVSFSSFMTKLCLVLQR